MVLLGSTTPVFKAALEAWQAYAGRNNPVSYVNENDGFYYHFENGPAAFFVFDTRFHLTETVQLGEVQMEAFFEWMLSVNTTATFKFLMTPNPITLNYLDGNVGWGAARDEVRALLLSFENFEMFIIIRETAFLLLLKRIISKGLFLYPVMHISSVFLKSVQASWK